MGMMRKSTFLHVLAISLQQWVNSEILCWGVSWTTHSSVKSASTFSCLADTSTSNEERDCLFASADIPPVRIARWTPCFGKRWWVPGHGRGRISQMSGRNSRARILKIDRWSVYKSSEMPRPWLPRFRNGVEIMSPSESEMSCGRLIKACERSGQWHPSCPRDRISWQITTSHFDASTAFV
jgi:hypothetical protein